MVLHIFALVRLRAHISKRFRDPAATAAAEEHMKACALSLSLALVRYTLILLFEGTTSIRRTVQCSVCSRYTHLDLYEYASLHPDTAIHWETENCLPTYVRFKSTRFAYMLFDAM